MSSVGEYLAAHKTDFEEDLKSLLRIPSVSTDSAFTPHVNHAADWMVEHFASFGLTAEKIKTAGHPIIYAETPPVPGAPVALVYGHYDVQPPDPLDEWITPPFEPTVRDGNLYARGATDDKGQMLTHVMSVKAWMQTVGKLPLQIKFLIEGEEEIGSEHLDPFLKENTEKLACDVIVISDTSQFGPGMPAITYGLKGIAYFELRLKGPSQDLHSGVFGGAVTNPANTLAKMLASLTDADGRIQVPGFYDDVVELEQRERDSFAALPFSEEAFEKSLGVNGVTGEKGYTTLERRWARPTCDVNGLWSGYQGEGAKTVLPAKAGGKFSFRLVPNQDPEKVAASLKEYLSSQLPPGITMELIDFHNAPGVLISLDSPYMAAAEKAIETGFGTAPVMIREGGSIPVVNAFQKFLGADTLLLGWGLNDDNTHSPNEKFHLADFHRGIASSAALWEEIGKLKK